MQSDFAGACKAYKGTITVPPVPLEAIRSAGEQPCVPWGRRVTAASAAIVMLATLGVGIAFGSKILRDLHIWFPSTGAGNMYISADHMTGSFRVTAKTLRETIAASPFRVALPTGLPQGTRLHLVFVLSGANRGALMLNYSYPISGKRVGFAMFLLGDRALSVDLTPPTFVRGVAPAVAVRTRRAAKSQRWLTGNETVVVYGTLSSRELARVRKSMATTSPQEALASAISMTGEIVPVGVPTTMERAERFRRPGIYGYLIDGTMVPSFVRILHENATQSLSGSYVDVWFRPGANYAMRFRAAGGRYRPFGAPMPKLMTHESIAAHNILAIANALRVKPLKADHYDFLVYARDATCDLVWALPRVPGQGATEPYTVSVSTAAKCQLPVTLRRSP